MNGFQQLTEREMILFNALRSLVGLIATAHNVYGQPGSKVGKVTRWLMDQDSYKTAANTVAAVENWKNL